MENEQFKALKAEFKALKERWEAAETLEERVALNEQIMDVLTEAQALVERCQNELLIGPAKKLIRLNGKIQNRRYSN